MKKHSYLLLLSFFFFTFTYSQTGTFIGNTGSLIKFTLNGSTYTSTVLNTDNSCMSVLGSIGLDGDKIYGVDGIGDLYVGKINIANDSIVNCTYLGNVNGKGYYNGLTVGPGGIVYIASSDMICTYDPTTNIFGALVGFLPNGWSVSGDLVFYNGKLYEAVKSAFTNTDYLVEVDLADISNSKVFITFTAPSIFGLATTTVSCANNQMFAISAGGNTQLYVLDMVNGTQDPNPAYSLFYFIGDAASIAETQTAQIAKPIFKHQYNLCQNDTIKFNYPTVASKRDTIRWYTQAVGGTSSGHPTPPISTASLGSTTYYLSAFDTTTGCESERDSFVVTIHPYTPRPIITPQDSVVICSGNSITLTSNIATGNQWQLNGVDVSGANKNTFSATKNGIYNVTIASYACNNTSLPTKVIVTDTIRSFNQIFICQSQFPYSWNGLVFGGVGTKTKTGLKTITGCDSAATLTILAIVPTLDTITIEGCDTVFYKTKWYKKSTNFIDTLRYIKGCDSIYRCVKAVITPVIPVTKVKQRFTSCDSVWFRGVWHSNSAIITDTTPSFYGCDSIYANNVIDIFNKPTLGFSKDTIKFLPNTWDVLKPITTSASRFLWTPSVYLNSDTAQFPVCTPLKDITYKLQVWSDSGCTAVNYLRIKVFPTIDVPTAFSPNGDGINDTWEIANLKNYPQNTVQVFSRSGQLLYSTFTGNYKPWNGKNNEQDVPVGVYYYIINLSPSMNAVTGYVTVLR